MSFIIMTKRVEVVKVYGSYNNNNYTLTTTTTPGRSHTSFKGTIHHDTRFRWMRKVLGIGYNRSRLSRNVVLGEDKNSIST
jgi:hypothetical protein